MKYPDANFYDIKHEDAKLERSVTNKDEQDVCVVQNSYFCYRLICQFINSPHFMSSNVWNPKTFSSTTTETRQSLTFCRFTPAGAVVSNQRDDDDDEAESSDYSCFPVDPEDLTANVIFTYFRLLELFLSRLSLALLSRIIFIFNCSAILEQCEFYSTFLNMPVLLREK